MLVRCFRYQLEVSIDISRSDRWSCKLLKPTLLGWFVSVLDDFSKKYQVDNNPYLMTLMLLQSCTAYSHSHFHFKKEASTQSIPKPGLVSNTMSFESFDEVFLRPFHEQPQNFRGSSKRQRKNLCVCVSMVRALTCDFPSGPKHGQAVTWEVPSRKSTSRPRMSMWFRNIQVIMKLHKSLMKSLMKLHETLWSLRDFHIFSRLGSGDSLDVRKAKKMVLDLLDAAWYRSEAPWSTTVLLHLCMYGSYM